LELRSKTCSTLQNNISIKHRINLNRISNSDTECHEQPSIMAFVFNLKIFKNLRSSSRMNRRCSKHYRTSFWYLLQRLVILVLQQELKATKITASVTEDYGKCGSC